MHGISCEYGKIYVGETGRTIETRLKEHRRHFRLAQPEKSAVAEHSINEDHAIRWEDTKILCRSQRYWDRIVKEAIEIRLNTKNFNRDTGFHLSNTWTPVLKCIKNLRKEDEIFKQNIGQSDAT